MSLDMPMNIEGRTLPQFSLRENDLPDLVTWEVGDKRYVVMKVEMVAKNSGSAYGFEENIDRSKLEGTFRMLSVRTLGIEPVDAKSLETKEFNDVMAKVLSGEA